MIQQHVCHTARRRLWRAACGEREARVAAGAAVGASGLGTLWSVVTATSAEERLGDKPLCAPHSPAQAATTCSLLGAGSQGGGGSGAAGREACWARCGVWSAPRAQRGEVGGKPLVRRTARRRVWRAACEEREARGPLELLGARGSPLQSVVSTAAHRRVQSPGWAVAVSSAP